MELDHRPHFRTTSTGHSNTTTATNELFICFSSRLSSSSSMKLTKSILSPGRAAASSRDGASGPVSLSSSLSRRLRSNGSLKGGASPFFTSAAGKRRGGGGGGGGGGFENPEPSSPKVTCIGQVRVKTKKKKGSKQARSLSKRRSGEMSFRKTTEHQQSTAADNNNTNNNGSGGEKDQLSTHHHQQIRYSSNGSAHYQQQQAQECLPHSRNQRWVHLPISICEALREFSCLFPCKSSCFSRDHKPETNKQNGPGENGCGAVFARWLVSVNDGEGGKRREIELVVGGGDEEEEARVSVRRSSRRHVFEDIEVKDDRIEIKGQSLEVEEEEKARVSICIPPKNALLLMRCRSDPMKMASLANRFSWDAAQGVCENDCENVEEGKNEVVGEKDEMRGCEESEANFEQDVTVLVENNEEQEVPDEENLELVEARELGNVEENKEDELLVITSNEEMVEENEKDELQQEMVRNEENLEENKEEEEEVESNMSSFEALLDQGNAEHYEDTAIQDDDDEHDEEVEVSPSIRHLSPSTEADVEIDKISPVLEEAETSMEKENEGTEEDESNTITEKDPTFVEDNNENIQVTAQVKPDLETTQLEDEQQNEEENSEMEKVPENEEFLASNIYEEPKNEKESQILPDCLLLMMCEPKLSMEVSKETWVCSTDFIRWLPERPRKAAPPAPTAKAASAKRRLSIDSKLNKASVRNNISDQQQQQPPRSSCSLPVATTAASMASMIEQKLVNAVGYEPFVLKRCKSEPMRTAAAKLMPESCFWKNAVRKLEPHRRAPVGVGTAGVGF